MVELSFEYWNQLTSQLIVISSLLGGFSITAVANFLVSNLNGKLARSIIKAAIVASSSFIVAIFAMNKIFMATTPGYPSEVNASDLMMPRLIGFAAFLLGILSLITMIMLTGWTRSKPMGWFTTIIGIVALLLIMMMIY